MIAATKTRGRKAPDKSGKTRGSLWTRVRGVFGSWLHPAMFVLGFVACGIGSIAIGQDNNWDLRNYHWYNPWAFLHGRYAVDFAMGQLQTYLNPVQDLPFYLLAGHLPPRVFGFVFGGIQGLSFGIIFAICFTVFRGFGRWQRFVMSFACAGVGIYGPIFVAELGGSMNDSLLSLLTLTGIYLLVRVLASGEAMSSRWRPVFVASILFGMAAGLKMTVAAYVIGLGVAVLFVERSWSGRLRAAGICVLGVVAGFLITNGFWMAYLWRQFGNPVFPFFNDTFESPWARFSSFNDTRYLPKTPGAALTLPFSFTYESEFVRLSNQFRDARFAVMFVLMGISVLAAIPKVVRRIRGKKQQRSFEADGLFMLLFVAVSFVVWEARFSVIRYTAAIEVLAPLAIVVMIVRLVRFRPAQMPLIICVFLFLVLMVRPANFQRAPWGDTFWDVPIPPVPNPEKTLIIVANGRPWGYLAPLFPPEVRWVRLKSNLTGPTEDTRLQSEMRSLIENHDGDMYVLTRVPPSVWWRRDQQVLASYGLKITGEYGLAVKSPYSRPGLGLWTLEHSP